MRLVRVRSQNFRNLQSLDLEIGQGFVVVVGKNGAGKTNFLEALYFGLTLRRFPTSNLSQFFRNGQDFFTLNITVQAGGEKNLEIVCQKKDGRAAMRLKINGQETVRSKFIKNGAAVSFLPEDLNLLTHSPAGRRRFYDETLSAANAEYSHALSQYERALKQRNSALVEHADLEVWDDALATHGSVIGRGREIFSEYIRKNIEAAISGLSPELNGISFQYQAGGASVRDVFLAKLKESRSRDLERLNTSTGPHRDDFEIIKDGQAAVGYLSRGQLRAITLALKIIQKSYLEDMGRPSVLLLDDVFSEFDAGHQQRLLKYLKTFDQVFLTTTHLEEIKSHFPDETKSYNIENGHVQQSQ